ncbi:hypothetical protein BaRGS_00033232 [Batillaria attramentaria]|uniref:Uncharacterized protein n=1 Tax=Batillaria attramentaria TaxID=370345 RepID=A0ABD0JLF6_9CAEN
MVFLIHGYANCRVTTFSLQTQNIYKPPFTNFSIKKHRVLLVLRDSQCRSELGAAELDPTHQTPSPLRPPPPRWVLGDIDRYFLLAGPLSACVARDVTRSWRESGG